MKKLLLITSLLFSTIYLAAQGTYTFYQFEYKPSSTTYYYTVAMPPDTAVNTNKRPVYIFLPGRDEIGNGKNTLANAVKYGYQRDLYLGLWNGGVTQSNGYADSIVYPIYVTLQSSGTYGSGGVDHQSIQYTGLKNRIGSKMDEDQIHIGGLSLGGRWVLLRLSCGNVSTSYRPFALLPASAFPASPGGKTTTITDSTEQIGRWVNSGGRLGIMTGQNDDAGSYKSGEIMSLYNGILPGSAVGEDWVSGVNGFTEDKHCCWDTLFKFNRTYNVLGNKSIIQWQAQFTGAPKAIAQNTINTSSNTVTLNGVSNGRYKTVAWTKVSGGSVTITNPNSDTTTVTGLTPGAYVFRMTVTNTNDSRTATHDVTVNVKDYGYAEDTYSPTITAATNFSEQYLHIDRITFLNFKTFNLYSRVDNQSAGAASFSVAIPDRIGSSLRGVGSGAIVYDNGTVKPIGCTATGTTMTCKFEAVSGSQGTIHISGGYQ